VSPNLALRRPVWLTIDQRHEIRDAAIRAMSNPQGNLALCEAILRELVESTRREQPLMRLVTSFVRGLNMPEGTVPVYLNIKESEHLVTYGALSPTTARLLEDRPVRGRRARI
jgi:hypothetical protein